MKKVVIMGGGLNQMPLINKCKSEYYTVVCDANKNAMGKDVADEFRCIDISDASKVVEVCREIGAAGVVCNTESLMPCSARVQTELGLVGNTPEAVMNSSDKFLFRQTQERAGVFYPKMQLFSDYETAKAYAAQSKVPLIIKPAESSGSREEGLKKTQNDLIHIGCPIPFDNDIFLVQMGDLMRLSYLNRDTVRDQVVKMVSTYHPENAGANAKKDKTYEEQRATMEGKVEADEADKAANAAVK